MIPITQNVIDLVHEMANNDDMKEGLNVETKSGLILYDSAWISGVDYQVQDIYGDDDDDDVETNKNENDTNLNELWDIIDDKMHPTNEQQQIDDNPIVNLEEENNGNDVIIENENNNIENDDIEDINANEYFNASVEENIDENAPTSYDEDVPEDYDEQLYDTDVVPSETMLQSGLISKKPYRLHFLQYNLLRQVHEETQYTEETAKVIAKAINHLIRKQHHL
jgi:hypothetical protein